MRIDSKLVQKPVFTLLVEGGLNYLIYLQTAFTPESNNNNAQNHRWARCLSVPIFPTNVVRIFKAMISTFIAQPFEL